LVEKVEMVKKKKKQQEGVAETSPTSQRSLGETLLQARLQKKLTLEEVERATKIRKKHLTAFENNDFSQLPKGAFGRGLLQSYARFLGVDLSPFRSIFLEKERLVNFYQTGSKLIHFNPRTVLWLSVVTIGLAVFGYIVFQISAFSAPPKLNIIQPALNTQVNSDKIIVEGQTDISAEVFINGQAVKTDVEGRFREQVHLAVGENTLKIVARGKTGKETVVERLVIAKYEGAIASPTVLAVTNDLLRVEILIKNEPTWLEVTVDGKAEFVGIANPGDRKKYQGRKVIVTSGKYSATKIYLNGKEVIAPNTEGTIAEWEVGE